jgi:hypothetical protein
MEFRILTFLNINASILYLCIIVSAKAAVSPGIKWPKAAAAPVE